MTGKRDAAPFYLIPLSLIAIAIAGWLGIWAIVQCYSDVRVDANYPYTAEILTGVFLASVNCLSIYYWGTVLYRSILFTIKHKREGMLDISKTQ